MPHTLIPALQATLQPLADPVRASAMSAYMRHHFVFLGIPTPVRRKATAPLLRRLKGQPAPQLLQLAQTLWALPEREYQYTALDLLTRHVRALDLEQLAALLALAQDKSWWDSVDPLAGVVGDLVRAARTASPDAQHCMDQALHHDCLWVRRIAMLHQLGWKQETDTRRLFAYALTLANEEDFFIRKAIGWALRDYAHHCPDAVRQFLADNGKPLSPLTRREAAKHL